LKKNVTKLYVKDAPFFCNNISKSLVPAKTIAPLFYVLYNRAEEKDTEFGK